MSNDTQQGTRVVPAPAPKPDLATLPVDAPPVEDKGRLGSVFFTSVGISALFVAWGVLFTDNLSTVTTSSLNWSPARSAGPTSWSPWPCWCSWCSWP